MSCAFIINHQLYISPCVGGQDVTPELWLIVTFCCGEDLHMKSW